MKTRHLVLIIIGLCLIPLGPSLALEPVRTPHGTVPETIVITDEAGRPLETTAVQPGELRREDGVLAVG